MASLIHPSSSESVTSQLDLLSVPPTQTSLEDGLFTEYRPLSMLTSAGPVEFCIAAESSNYIDLANTFQYVRASVMQADGTDLEQGIEIAPECNFLHTLWSQCDLYLNDTLVTQSSNNYSYRSYMEMLLSFGKDAKDSQLSSVLWYLNTAGAFNTPGANNAGYTKRKAFAAQSHEIDMMGRLHLDMGFQSRYILNGIENIKSKKITPEACRSKNVYYTARESLFFKRKPVFGATTHPSRGRFCRQRCL